MGKHLRKKYSQKPLDTAEKYTTDLTKTASKRAIQKTAAAAARQTDERDKSIIFKNYAPFTKSIISRINGTDIDNTQKVDIVMPMFNLIEYSDNFSEKSGSLWQ